MVPHAYGRVGVAAALALQGYVAEERVAVRALPTQQQRPRHIGNTSAFWTGRSQVRVAFALRLTDCPGAPKGNRFPWRLIIA